MRRKIFTLNLTIKNSNKLEINKTCFLPSLTASCVNNIFAIINATDNKTCPWLLFPF